MGVKSGLRSTQKRVICAWYQSQERERERELSKSLLIALIDTSSTSTSQDQDIKGNVNLDGLEYCVGVFITVVLHITIKFIDYCYTKLSVLLVHKVKVELSKARPTKYVSTSYLSNQ